MGRGRPAPQPFSVAEGEWRGAEIETCRIVNVNITAWTVDVISEYGNKRYFDIQVMSSYFHPTNGEGVYVQPEVGAMVWVCKPSAGRFAQAFVMGFQSVFDSNTSDFSGGRQALNPGDIMLRTRDENFIILRRGGVVQIGATPTAQRMFIPIKNIIRDFCENYELLSFGGELTWTTQRDDKTTDGAAMTKFSLLAKEKANDPKHVAELTIGSHGDGDKTTLLLKVNESGAKDAKLMVSLTVTKEGNVTWTTEKDYVMKVKKNYQLESAEGDITVKASQGAVNVQASKAISIKSDTDAVKIEASQGATLKGGSSATIDAPMVSIGGSGASSPLIKGDKLVSLLSTLITQISTFTCAAPGSPVVAAASVASLAGQLQGLLSTTSFTK